MSADLQPSSTATLDEYLAELLAALPTPETLVVGTFDAVGLVLSDDVYSVNDLPRSAAAACDGIAVQAHDLAAASIATPVAVNVVDDSLAASHDSPQVVGRRIWQGDPLPYGCDAVVHVGKVTVGERRVVVTSPVEAGENVATVGSDVTQNQLLAVNGHIVTPADVALFSAAGVDRVPCVPAPRIVIVGVAQDELTQPNQQPAGDTRAVAMMIAASVRSLGAMVFLGGETFPTRDALAAALDANLGRADLIVLVGGSRTRTLPRVAAVLSSLGSATVSAVNVEWLESQLFGRVGTCPVVAVSDLPGPAHRTFEYVLRPIVRQLQGRRDGGRPTLSAQLTARLAADDASERLVAVRLKRVAGEWIAEPMVGPAHMSHVSVAQTDGYVRVPKGPPGCPAGSTVRVELVTE